MQGEAPPGQPRRQGWLSQARAKLSPFRPRLKDWNFWVIQCLIVAIVALHLLIELHLGLPALQSSDFVPSALFFVPVAYAALRYGFAGSVGAALWATILTMPNLVMLHHGPPLIGKIIQLLIVNATAFVLGYWVDMEGAARKRAKAYAAIVVDASEKERQRVARDLHDDTVQTLALLCQELDAVGSTPSLPPTAMEKLRAARKTAEQASMGLRDLTQGLRPPILDDLGVVAAIRKLLMDAMDQSGIEGQLGVVGTERRLPRDLELGLFRIAQEALSNVKHHAGAKNAAVVLTFGDKQIGLDIQDDGRGFAVPGRSNGAVGNNKLGLIGMMERAELMGGTLDIQSRLAKGTRITASVPATGKSE